MDKLSKSDPFVVVKWKTDSDETWREVGELSLCRAVLVVCCSRWFGSSPVPFHTSPSSWPRRLDQPPPPRRELFLLNDDGAV